MAIVLLGKSFFIKEVPCDLDLYFSRVFVSLYELKLKVIILLQFWQYLVPVITFAVNISTDTLVVLL